VYDIMLDYTSYNFSVWR